MMTPACSVGQRTTALQTVSPARPSPATTPTRRIHRSRAPNSPASRPAPAIRMPREQPKQREAIRWPPVPASFARFAGRYADSRTSADWLISDHWGNSLALIVENSHAWFSRARTGWLNCKAGCGMAGCAGSADLSTEQSAATNHLPHAAAHALGEAAGAIASAREISCRAGMAIRRQAQKTVSHFHPSICNRPGRIHLFWRHLPPCGQAPAGRPRESKNRELRRAPATVAVNTLLRGRAIAPRGFRAGSLRRRWQANTGKAVQQRESPEPWLQVKRLQDYVNVSPSAYRPNPSALPAAAAGHHRESAVNDLSARMARVPLRGSCEQSVSTRAGIEM